MMHVSITGLGRGGTSITGHIFSTHPRVEFRHERSTFWMRDHFDIQLMGRLTPDQASPERIAQAGNWARPRKAGDLLVEKDPRHVMRMAYMRKLWPEARFIYLVRDPRDMTCSVIQGLRKKGKSAEVWLAERDGYVVDWLKDLPLQLRLIAWWQHVVLTDLHEMRGDPLCRVLKYEQLLADPWGTAVSLFNWVGLDLTPKVKQFLPNVADNPSVHVSHFSAGNFVRGHTRRVGRWHDEWKPEHARGAWRIAGDTMTALGYTED